MPCDEVGTTRGYQPFVAPRPVPVRLQEPDKRSTTIGLTHQANLIGSSDLFVKLALE